MVLVQLLLPLYDNEHRSFESMEYARVRKELTERFGGLTSYVRSPASGLWKEDSNTTVRDDIIIYEVMAESLDAVWWRSYRQELCRRFRQESLVVRALSMELL